MDMGEKTLNVLNSFSCDEIMNVGVSNINLLDLFCDSINI